MRRPKYLYQGVALCALTLPAAPAQAIISNDNQTNINALLGATTFYANGFTGTSATVASIEAGVVWDQQISLTRDTVEFSDPSVTPQFDLHATAVGAIINGIAPSSYSPPELGFYGYQGIAYGATLWSGAIATSWASEVEGQYTTEFTTTPASIATPYEEAMVSGVPSAGGATADIINSSWGDSTSTDGHDNVSMMLDALVNQSGKTLIFSTDNYGPASDTIYAPATGMNAIVVGALQSDTTTPPYGTIAGFSSRSPSDLFVPSNAAGTAGTEMTGVRALVDITAPGTDLVLPGYLGTQGGGQFGYGEADPPTNVAGGPFGGTSFAAPFVSGGAALVVDAGKTLFPNDSRAIDGRVIKAILMNSADKPAGWNNGQTTVNGVTTTTQSLDYTYGAGSLDLNQAWTQYTSGTTDLVDSTGHPTMTGGSVQPTGWAFGQVTHIPNQTATVDYTITTPLASNAMFDATLDWFADESVTPSANPAGGLVASYGSFDNLDLSVYLLTGGAPQLVAESDSAYNSVQELHYLLPADGTYMLQVSETNYLWNFNGDTTTDFGLAWATTSIPEPTGAGIMVFATTCLLARRRK
jgi:hypothetical protein